jgi:hypothetical protein
MDESRRREIGWAPHPIWTLWSGEQIFVPSKSRTSALQLVAPLYKDLTIPVPLHSRKITSKAYEFAFLRHFRDSDTL